MPSRGSWARAATPGMRYVVHHLDATVDFYCRLLGFEVERNTPMATVQVRYIVNDVDAAIAF